MKDLNRLRVVVFTAIAVTLTAAAVLLIRPAIAGPDPVAAAPSKVTAGPIAAVHVIRETAAKTTTSTTFANLPGAATNFSVPAGKQLLVLARFSGESSCYGGAGWCSVRILIGSEAAPAVGVNFAFDSNDGGTESSGSWEGHSMDRTQGPLGPGTYNVQVQWRVVKTCSGCAATTFALDDWSLTVEFAEK